MKNNKGFTIIELAVSFCLVAAVSITLLQLVLTLKEVYLSGDVKTTLLNKQGIMTKKIYDDLNSYTLTEIKSCGISCLTFSYTEKEDAVKLIIDPGNRTLTYGDYTIKLDSSSYFGKLEMSTDEPSESLGKVDSIFKIDIPIISKLLDEDLGIHIVKTYNSSGVTINNQLDLSNLSSTDIVATLNGINLNKDSILPYFDNTNLSNFFLRVYHQEAENYFSSNYDDFIKNDNSKTFSVLGSLSAFKQTINIDNVIGAETEYINSQNLTDREKKKQITNLKEAYQNGYYSLLLNYNNENLSNYNYSWWYQTSNFASKEILSQFTTGHKYDSYDTSYIFGNISNGITYNNSNESWANILGTNYNIGIKSGAINSPNGDATSIDLYVEAREYICKYSLSNVTYNGHSLNKEAYADGYLCS